MKITNDRNGSTLEVVREHGQIVIRGTTKDNYAEIYLNDITAAHIVTALLHEMRQ